MTNPPVFPGSNPDPAQPQLPPQTPVQPATEQYPSLPAAPYGAQSPEQYPSAPAAPFGAAPTEQYAASGYPQQPASAGYPEQPAAYPDVNGQYPGAYQDPNAGYQQPQNPGYAVDPNAGYAAAPSAEYPGYTPAAMPPKKSKKGLFIGLGVTAGVLLIGGIGVAVAANALTASHQPELKVESYLDSLVAGKAEAALKLSGGYDGTASTELLTDEVYEAATARVDSYKINDVSTSGTKSTVRATLTDSEGGTLEQTFTLKSTGKEFLFYDLWKLDAIPMDSITAEVNGPEGYTFAVNGVDVPAEVLQGEGAAVFPGTYEVAAAVSDFYTVDEAQPLVAGVDGQSVPASFGVGLSDKGVQAANDAVNAFIDSCIAQPSFMPEGCPFGANTNADIVYTNIRWTLLSRPNVTFGDWNGSGFSVTSDRAGDATGYSDISKPSTGQTGTSTATLPNGFGVSGSITGFDDAGKAIFESIPYF